MQNRFLWGAATFLLAGSVAMAQGTSTGTTGQSPQTGESATGQAPPPAGQPTTGQAATGATQETMSKAQTSAEATKHVSVLDAALIDANNNATMLRELTKDVQSYDAEHGRIFVTNISNAINQAETQLRHLTPMATSSKDSAKVQQLQTHLGQARALVPTMQSSLNNPQALNRDATQIMNLTKNSVSPLKDVAKSLNAKVTVRSTG